MDNNKYAEDIKEIRDIMNRTTRFISLSGLSGVSTGIAALLGVFMSYRLVFKNNDYLVHHAVEMDTERLTELISIACGTLILAIGLAIFFTRRKAKRQNHSVFGIPSKQLLINLSIPLAAGGLLCLLVLLKGYIGMLPSLTLIFYGLALINGSKYTLTEIRNLGLIQILLGLLAYQFVGFSLLFWAVGFGLIQMVYGFLIHMKYKL
jgi:hypothetical protein